MLSKLFAATLIVLVIAAIVVIQTQGATTSEQKLAKSKTVVAWYKGQGWWHLRPGFRKCSQIRWSRPAARCWRHRENLRWHTERVRRLTPRPTVRFLSAWECIHSHEGSWTDGGAPYWGGLQMDWSFMSTYGPELLRSKGTADNWTPLEQMMVAERAWRTRGFTPWPNTARMCGLL